MAERLGNLVLTRRAGEYVRIGDTLVKVGEIRGQRVKLVIRAPRDVEVSRPENDRDAA